METKSSPVKFRLPIEQIMARVRAELAWRRNGQTGLSDTDLRAKTPSPEGSLPRWQPAVPRLPFKREYVLPELLAFSDADFIHVAYRAITRRSPDDRTLKHFLSQLRGGLATKVEIICAMCESPEGRERGVVIHGLRQPYLLQRWRRKTIVGPILGWIHAFLRLGTVNERRAVLDAAQAQESQEVGRVLNQVSDHLMRRIEALEAHERKIESLTAPIQALLAREQLLKEERRALDSFYAAFEDRFRGTREVVRARCEPYLEVIRQASAGTVEAPVLDVGCGRGEWLELLRDHGLVGRGIDSNRVFIDMCHRTGLDVIEGDVIEALKVMQETSVGAVTSMHLIEHLPFEQVIALLDEAQRILRPGGLILLETPNPENLSVGHHFFYMDPTHRNPLPPEALRFIVEARGFEDVRIERLTTARELMAPPLIPEDLPGAASINVLLGSLNAPADYAVIGIRR